MTFLNLSGIFAKLNKGKKEVYITGDFNIDLLQYETNNKCKDFYNLVTSSGFLPLITQPTRFNKCPQTLIDNIFTNTFDHDCESGNILIEFADHFTQFASIKEKIHNTSNVPVYKLDQTKFDEKSFLDDLSIQNFIQSEDPNANFSDMLWKYESCARRHMPLKKMNSKEKKTSQKPWINNTILIKIKHRNELFRKKKEDPNNRHLRQTYNKFRNSVNRDIKKSKERYYLKYFQNCKSNMKKTWKGINDLIRSSNKSSTINQIQHNNTLINDSKVIADTFNNFFANVGPEIDNNTPKTPISPLTFL